MAEVGTRIQVIKYTGPTYMDMFVKSGDRGTVVDTGIGAEGFEYLTVELDDRIGRVVLVEDMDEWIECVVKASHG